ncbi:unnamed protein product, partial [Rotaria sp. Silwood2]
MIHESQIVEQKDEWAISTHTKKEPNNEYFGRLINDALYVRLDIETQLSKIGNILFKIWKIPKPNLIMSIIGGAKYFKLNSKLASSVIDGIMNVALKSNVWMITTGYDIGIVQLVGQAIHTFQSRNPKRNMIAIGISKWGTPVVTIVVEGGTNTIENMYYDLKENIPVVIINGSGRIANFFGRWLARVKNVNDEFEQGKVPFEIEELNIERTTSIPVLDNDKKIKSEKRIDIHVELHVNSSLQRKYKKELEEDLKNIIDHNDYSLKKNQSNSKIKNKDSNRKVQIALNQVMYCLQPAVRSQITVFNLYSDTSLSETIFESIYDSFKSLLKSTDKGQTKQTPFLELAMDWNCIHIAKKYVLLNSLDNILDPEEAFIIALQKDLPVFVYEFLKLGLGPADIFFPSNKFLKGHRRYDKFIEKLYGDMMDTKKTHLKYFIDKRGVVSNKKITSVDTLNSILEALIGDYMHKLYFDAEEYEEQNRIKWGLKKPTEKDTENNKSLSTEQKKHKANIYIMRDLYLWTILMNRIDIAKVLLVFMENRICSALIATKILKQYHSLTHYGELRDSYEKSIKYFEKYAIDCLNKCEDNDVDRTCELIIQQNELYGYVTCLQVASDANDKLFLSQPASVQTINNIWYNKLHPKQNSYCHRIALLSGIISFGLLAPVFATYRDDDKKREVGETLEQKVIMAYDIELWWLRSLSFVIVIPFLGPHLTAIGKMMKDLLFFLCILAIVVLAYGTASRSMAYFPTVNNFRIESNCTVDNSFGARSIFRHIIYPVYYLLYGKLNNERRCLDDAGSSITTHILLALHMLFVNILLITLFIAMLSKRFDQIYEDARRIWHSQQYLFLREYFVRSPLIIPPITVIHDVCRLCQMFFYYVTTRLCH